MKLSFILSAVLLTITLFVGLQLKKRTSQAKEHLQKLEETAGTLQILTNSPAKEDTAGQEKEVRELIDLSRQIARSIIQIEQSTEDAIEKKLTLRLQVANALIQLIDFRHEKLDLFAKIIVRDPDLDEETRLTMLKQVLLIMAMDEPEIAADRVLKTAERLELKQKDSAPLIRSVVMEFILRKPFDASTWLLLNEEELASCFEDLKMNLQIRMTELDPVSGLELLRSLSNPGKVSYDLFAFGLNSENAEVFFKTLRKLSLSEKVMDNFYFALVRGPLKHDFDSAIEVLDSGSLTTDERDRFLSALFFSRLQVSDDDLTKWLSYVISKPKSDVFDPVLNIDQQLLTLIERDYRSMGSWISNLPESTYKKDWVQTYIRTVSPHDSAAATEFAKANR